MEFVNILDKKYAENPVVCPNEGTHARLPQSGVSSTTHGNMQVHNSGAMLVCGWCGHAEPIARPN